MRGIKMFEDVLKYKYDCVSAGCNKATYRHEKIELTQTNEYGDTITYLPRCDECQKKVDKLWDSILADAYKERS